MSTKSDDNIDIEDEELGTPQITHPFDPQVIKIIHESVNLGSLIENLENNEIDLSPAFQRKSGLWSNIQKSRLIESLILGLPLPTFFFADETRFNEITGNNKSILLVVDGLQRLCTIQEFVIDKTLKLSNLEFLHDSHDGKKYDDLSREEQRKIKGSRITTSIIEEGNPPLVKFIIFRRINTGGLTLNEQEIRHALNQGLPADFLQDLAVSKEFIEATDGVIKTDRMLDREFINRFLAFYILGYDEKYSGDIELFLANGLNAINLENKNTIKDIKESFTRSMKCAITIFGNDAFRKPRSEKNQRRKALSKAIFDTLSVNLAKLTQAEVDVLILHKSTFLDKFNRLFLEDTEFFNSVSNATGTPKHVFFRFKKIREIILEVIENDY